MSTLYNTSNVLVIPLQFQALLPAKLRQWLNLRECWWTTTVARLQMHQHNRYNHSSSSSIDNTGSSRIIHNHPHHHSHNMLEIWPHSISFLIWWRSLDNFLNLPRCLWVLFLLSWLYWQVLHTTLGQGGILSKVLYSVGAWCSPISLGHAVIIIICLMSYDCFWQQCLQQRSFSWNLSHLYINETYQELQQPQPLQLKWP